MKKFVVALFAAVLLPGVQNLYAENKSEKFNVAGNCRTHRKSSPGSRRSFEGRLGPKEQSNDGGF